MKRLKTITLSLAAATIAAGGIGTLVADEPSGLEDEQRVSERGFGGHRRWGHGLGFGPEPGRMIERMSRHLDLTDAQREQIRAIHETGREQTRQLFEQLTTQRQELHESIASNGYLEDQVRVMAAAQAATIEELIVQHASVTSRIREVLTAEQLAELSELRERGHDRKFRH